MTIKYYCFRSTAEEGGVGSGLNGYVYFPTTIEAQVTQALVAGDIAYLATSEEQLVVLTLDNNAVYADNLSEGLPTKLSTDSGWFGLVNVASLERYEQGDISDAPAKKYIDQIKTLKGDTLSLRTKTSELENDSGFVTENQLATKQDKLTAGTNITISEDGTISANITSSDSSYELPTASTTTLGGVKVDGTTITIDENGVISSTTTSNGESSSGITNIPLDVYTTTNLIAGNGISIEIEKEPTKGDLDTIGLWHFNENSIDTVSNNELSNNPTISLTEHKFGTGSLKVQEDTFNSASLAQTLDPKTTSFTLEFWHKQVPGTTVSSWGDETTIVCSPSELTSTGYKSSWLGLYMLPDGQNNVVRLQIGESRLGTFNTSSYTTLNEWNHYALTWDYSTKYFKLYMNGTYVDQYLYTDSINYLQSMSHIGVFKYTGGTDSDTKAQMYIDELRLSSGVKYTETFSVQTTEFTYNQPQSGVYRIDNTAFGDSYTQDNLVGSENVQIVDETEGNGDINSDTNLYITFDEPNTFEDKSLKQTKFQVLNNPSDIVLTEGIFGTGLESCSSGNITLKNETNLTTNSLQNVAFWFKMPQVFGRLRIILAPNESIADLTQATEVYEIRYQEGTNENGNIMYFLVANQNSLVNSGYAVQVGYYYNNLINGVINESGWNYIVFTKIGEQFAITLNGNQLYNNIPTYAFTNSEFNTVMLTSTATADNVNYIYNIDELNIINNNSNYWNIQAEQSTPIVLTGKKQIQQNKLLTTDTHQSIYGSKSFESFTYFMGGVNVISNSEKQINIYGESYQTPIIINQHTSGITDGEISNVSIRDYGTLKSQQKVSVDNIEGTTTTEIKSCVDGLNTTSLSVVAYTNGNGYAALDNIALSDEDNSNKIPTTAWVNQRIESHTPANTVTGVGITSIVRITQSEYDALTVKDENTFYVIVGE